jgi:hypothetical protein
MQPSASCQGSGSRPLPPSLLAMEFRAIMPQPAQPFSSEGEKTQGGEGSDAFYNSYSPADAEAPLPRQVCSQCTCSEVSFAPTPHQMFRPLWLITLIKYLASSMGSRMPLVTVGLFITCFAHKMYFLGVRCTLLKARHHSCVRW